MFNPQMPCAGDIDIFPGHTFEMRKLRLSSSLMITGREISRVRV